MKTGNLMNFMNQKLKGWFAPPIFPNDENRTRRAALLNSILLTNLALVVFLIAGNLAGGNVPLAVNGVDILFLAVCLILRHWAYQGRVKLAAVGVLAVGLAGITAAIAMMGTIRVPSAGVYMLLVIVAGLLFDLGGMIVMSVLCALTIAGLIVAENMGWLPQPDYSNSITQWVTYTALFAWAGSLTLSSLRSSRLALTRAEQEIVERRQANEALINIQQLLRETEKMGMVGGWEFNIDSGQQIWTEEIYQIHEVDPTYNPTLEKGIEYYAPASRPIIEKAVQRAVEHGEQFDVELEIITAKGNRRWVHAIGQADLKRRRVFGFFQDISERKQAEAATRESESKFRQVFELSPIGIVMVGLDKQFIRTNYAFSQSLGYETEELVGKTIDDVTFPADKQIGMADMMAIMKGEIANSHVHKRYLRKDGEVVWGEVTISLIRNSEGHAEYFLAIIQDVTSRKQAQEERELTLHLIEMINNPGDFRESISAITASLQGWSGCEAIGIRLRAGDDYPYYETRGFPPAFVKAESRLCAYNQNGEILRDDAGSPVLECMCGNILSGRFDPAKPFFTAHGSFWSNNTTVLLASTTEADRQARTRNRCNGEGYESVALIPLHIGSHVIGLLQFNDHHANRFTPQLIAVFERMADSLAIAISRRQAMETLRESEERFKNAFQYSAIGMALVSPAGKWLKVNAQTCSMVGYSENELLLKTFQDITHPEDLDLDLNYVQQMLRGEIETYTMEKRYFHKNGNIIWVLLAVSLVRDEAGVPLYFISQINDITERKLAEERLKVAKEHFEMLFHTNPDAVQITRLIDGLVQNVNDGFTLMSGFTPEDIIGKRTLDIDLWEHPQDRQHVIDELTKNGYCGNYEAIFKRKDGSRFVGMMSARLYLYQNEPHVIIVTRDITDRKQAEEKIIKLNAELEQRVEERTKELREAQEQVVRHEKLAVLGQMAGSVGHELRNPLAVISSAIYYLNLVQPDADKDIKKHLGIIDQEVHNSERIITDLLDFSRTKSSVDREVVSVSELIRQTLERFPAPPSVKVTIDSPPDLPQISVDPRQMTQVLGNLTVNACQAMPKGGQLSIIGKQVSVKTESLNTDTSTALSAGNWVLITVRDSGAGITPENMKKLFEPLFTTKTKGIGLGLAVSQKLVEANGGRIEVESEPGVGSSFTLFLPIFEAQS